jgi:hypothetical protein
VKHSRGHLGHAGEPRKFNQTFLRFLQLGVSTVFGHNLFLQLAGAFNDTKLQFYLRFKQSLLRLRR